MEKVDLGMEEFGYCVCGESRGWSGMEWGEGVWGSVREQCFCVEREM